MKKYFSRGVLATFIVSGLFLFSILFPVTPASAQTVTLSRNMDICQFLEILISMGVIPESNATALRSALGCPTPPVPVPVPGPNRPVVNIIGTPTISLSFDGNGRESSLISVFKVRIDNPGSGDAYIYRDWVGVRFVDGKGNTDGGPFSSVFSSTSGLPEVMDEKGQVMYTLNAGQSEGFTLTTRKTPSKMFAGYYYAAVDFIYANTGIRASKSYSLTIPQNRTNMQVITGEYSPYINSATFTQNIVPGFDTVKVTGVRLSKVDQAVVSCSLSGQGTNKVHSANTSEAVVILAASGKYNNGESCWVEVSDPNEGASNRYGFMINGGGPTATSSVIVISPSVSSIWPIGSRQTISWKSYGDALRNNVQIGLIDNRYSTEVGDRAEQIIDYSTTNTGSYSWTVPARLGTMDLAVATSAVYQIIVHSWATSTPGVSGVSQPFSIITSSVPVPLNASPDIVSSMTVPSTILPGQVVNLGWKASDADNDDLSWQVDFGDSASMGTPCQIPHLQNGKDRVFQTNHAWSQAGTYQINVSVSDCVGGSDSELSSIVILPATSTPPVPPPTPTTINCKFDPIKYADYYADVKKTFGYDVAKLNNHWITWGISDGRSPCGADMPSCKFSGENYVSLYPDLIKAGVNGRNHYVQYGFKEGRDVCRKTIVSEAPGANYATASVGFENFLKLLRALR